MISLRTRLLLLAAVALSIAFGVILHRRQHMCTDRPHGFARRPPIAGASGRNTFVCSAMVETMPAAQIVLAATWWLSVIALGRSSYMDVHQWRVRRRMLLDDYKRY